jgi:lysophospholipase L1-like esterase
MVTIDYGANDRFQPMTAVEAAWRRMVEEALAARVKVILVTPAPDCGGLYYPPESKRFDMEEHAAMVRGLAGEYGVALADVFSAFAQKLEQGHRLHEYLISVNHLNRKGHRIIALSLHEWFPYAV